MGQGSEASEPESSEFHPAADDLIEHNRQVADAVKTPGMAAPPSRQVAIVTCMDARMDPLAELGLTVGEAHVIRNAGGVMTDDVMRSLCISQQLLGTREILVIHHTKCGMCGLDEAAFSNVLGQRLGARPSWPICSFADPADDVRAAIATLRASPFIEHDTAVRGFIYDVDTGLLNEVPAVA
ncbi:MAG: carbonic anhydrase [Acidimicrobiaceae bacterium]|uniref:beta-class carbonic anhydrase n=1 Tax=Candidatus Poriferisodalis multihospitum TaxID=2983191 RepID=UPI0013827CBC|nr:carbonic anhydrase [Candidatus Poriferisodalis multihospitum]MCY3950610.1 carbonic anhydrase [Acidimicrobiaceae bacterium]MXY03434.1 carbonic anhydrase [Acidimicrobiales bacterium]MDE0136184.1 carbonic anhydrase [Acidimicrobiaceae bacterium]MDE0676277.1 carbonic anhydrase [Acidimicrobiaceae bacterium]MYG89097.1 carbonic anhydrase [Acidimicrobiales bacterium]